MAHFCKIENGTVVDLIVLANADCGGGNFPQSELLGQAFIADLAKADDRLSGEWLQTSYNTLGNVHYGSDNQPDGGTPVRYNFAHLGSTYDPDRGEHGAFVPPQPYPSWSLDANCVWQAPTPQPSADHVWNEDEQEWQAITN